MFHDARLKIDRANKHISEIQSLVLSLEKGYVATIEVDRTTGGKSIKYECQKFQHYLTELSLITGADVHNLRTALDYAWISTIQGLCLPLTKWTKFPFYENPTKLQDALRERGIENSSPVLFKTIMTEIKPYPGGNFFLSGFHDADIMDKHKLLLPVVDCTSAEGISIQDENGAIHEVQLIPRYGSNGVIYIDFFPNIQIQEMGRISVSVIFHEGSPLVGSAIPEDLFAFSHFALKLIESLEQLIP
jgi:hypothetical protein